MFVRRLATPPTGGRQGVLNGSETIGRCESREVTEHELGCLISKVVQLPVYESDQRDSKFVKDIDRIRETGLSAPRLRPHSAYGRKYLDIWVVLTEHKTVQRILGFAPEPLCTNNFKSHES